MAQTLSAAAEMAEAEVALRVGTCMPSIASCSPEAGARFSACSELCRWRAAWGDFFGGVVGEVGGWGWPSPLGNSGCVSGATRRTTTHEHDGDVACDLAFFQLNLVGEDAVAVEAFSLSRCVVSYGCCPAWEAGPEARPHMSSHKQQGRERAEDTKQHWVNGLGLKGKRRGIQKPTQADSGGDMPQRTGRTCMPVGAGGCSSTDSCLKHPITALSYSLSLAPSSCPSCHPPSIPPRPSIAPSSLPHGPLGATCNKSPKRHGHKL